MEEMKLKIQLSTFPDYRAVLLYFVEILSDKCYS